MFPYIFLFEKELPVFGLCMSIGIMVSTGLAVMFARQYGLSINDLIIYIACIIGIAMIGAKGLYCLITYGLYNSVEMLLKGETEQLFGQGGFVFYGGVLGGLIGMIIAKKITGIRPEMYYTSVIPVIPIGHAIGRVGCFFAGCCYGKQYNGLGSLKFPRSIAGLSPDISVIPTQLIEAAGDVVLAFYLIKKYRKKKMSNKIFYEYLFLYACMRFCIEFLRGDIERGKLFFLSTSQWFSLILIIGILWRGKRKKYYNFIRRMKAGT